MRWLVFVMASLQALAAWAQATGRPVLGVGVADPPDAAPLRGAWVRQVTPRSAASAAGVRVDDVVVAADRQPVWTAAELTAYIAGLHAGQSVSLQVVRMSAAGPQQLRLDATLGASQAPRADGDAPPAAQYAQAPGAPSPPERADAQTAAAIPGDIHWTTYAEPVEHAYTAEVPRGWHVAGSVERRAELGASPYLRLMSPDRKVYVALGDPSLTLFTTPLRSPAARPAWEGQVVQPYAPSLPFARDYATGTLSKLCGDLTVTGERDRPDLTKGSWASMNPTARHSGGEVTFSCRRDSAAMRGAVLVENYIYPPPADIGGALWSVDLLVASFAPADRDAGARAIAMHVVESLRLQPQWVQQEAAKSDAVRGRIDAATEANRRIGAAAIASAQRKMHQTLQQGEAFDRIINGRSPYTDSTGRRYDLDNTKTQWIDRDGRIVGTDGASPGSGWEKLKEVPPE